MTLLSAASTLALLTGCSSTADPRGERSPEAAPAADETASASEEPTAGETEWPDWEWPEGYTYDLPAGVGLQEETHEYADPDYPDRPVQTYRRMQFDSETSPLLEAPEGLLEQTPYNESTLRTVLQFAGRYVVEDFMDSEVLLEVASPDLMRDWYTEHRFLFYSDLFEHMLSKDYLAEQSPPLISIGASQEGRETGSGDASGALVWPEGSQRSANVDVQLVGAHVFDGYNEGLELQYETSQTFLLHNANAKLDSVVIDGSVELVIWPGANGWEIADYATSWNVVDIENDL